MGLFNSKKEQNKYTADGTFPYNSDKVVKALYNIGYSVSYSQFSGKYTLVGVGGLIGDDIKVQVIPHGTTSTRVIVEASDHIGAMKFAGINMAALGNKMNAQKVMDKIIAYLQRH